MRILAGHTKETRAVAFAPDGRLVSGGADGKVRVWDPRAGELLETIKGPAVVYAVAVSPDGRTLVYGGRAGSGAGTTATVFRRDLATGGPLESLQWETGYPATSVWSLTYTADGAHFAAVGRRLGGGNFLNGGGGRWWQHGGPPAGAALAGREAYAARFAPTGTRLAVTWMRRVAVMEHPGGPPTAEYTLACDWSADAAFAEGGTLVYVARSYLCFANPAGKGKPNRVKTGLWPVTGIAVTPDGLTVVAGGKPGDAAVEVYDVPSGQKKAAYDFGIGPVQAVAVSPDGLTFAAGGAGGVAVCDLG